MDDEQFPYATWIVTENRLIWESGGIFTWNLHYDREGNYVGQEQENMFDEEPRTLFFKPLYDEEGKPTVNDEVIEPLSEETIAQIIAGENPTR